MTCRETRCQSGMTRQKVAGIARARAQIYFFLGSGLRLRLRRPNLAKPCLSLESVYERLKRATSCSPTSIRISKSPPSRSPLSTLHFAIRPPLSSEHFRNLTSAMTSLGPDRPFPSLSKDPDHPFSVWEKPEPATIDPLGRLAITTPELVQRAAREEIQTGARFSLDLSIEQDGFTLFGRKKAERTVRRIDRCAATKRETEERGDLWFPKHDDLIHINTQVKMLPSRCETLFSSSFSVFLFEREQSSTQFDGPCHVSYPGSGYFYGGATVEDVESGNIGRGIARWAEAGGIVGRGVLIDYARWVSPSLSSRTAPPVGSVSGPLTGREERGQVRPLSRVASGPAERHQGDRERAGHDVPTRRRFHPSHRRVYSLRPPVSFLLTRGNGMVSREQGMRLGSTNSRRRLGWTRLAGRTPGSSSRNKCSSSCGTRDSSPSRETNLRSKLGVSCSFRF